MSTNRPRSSARERLLDAAETAVCEHGVHELTLEAVAAAGGVTKGGLIYHFKTKEDLLGALVERMMAKLRERYSARMAASDQTTRGMLVALVDDTFEMSAQDKAVLSSLLAAISSYPQLLDPVRGVFDDVYGRWRLPLRWTGCSFSNCSICITSRRRSARPCSARCTTWPRDCRDASQDLEQECHRNADARPLFSDGGLWR